jgi:hypothetical protein
MNLLSRLVVCGFLIVSASLQTMAQSVQLPYKEVEVKNVNGTAVFNGASVTGDPGQPAVPWYTVSLLLPPGADLTAVSAYIDNPKYQDLAGEYAVLPIQPIRNEKGILEWPKGAKIVDGKDMAVYGMTTFFPSDFKGGVLCSQMRQYNLAQIRINPYLFNPATKKLRKLLSGTLRVSFSAHLSAGTNMPRSDWAEKILKTVIANPEALNEYGAVPSANVMTLGAARLAAPASSSPAADQVYGQGYLIIYSNRIRDSSNELVNYIDHLESLGATVSTRDDAQINPSGKLSQKEIAVKIRDEVKNWYDNSASPKFVLLIGNPCPIKGDVPMWLVDYSSVNDYDIATDYAYTDMDPDWMHQNSADLCVGRIPVYEDDDIDSLDMYLVRMMNYSTASGAEVEWRRNMLWAQTPLGAGQPSEENYTLGEGFIPVISSIGWTTYRLYDDYVQYVSPSHFLINDMVNRDPLWENVHCNETDMVNAWNSETPGLVFWHAHGGPDGSCGIISSNGADPSVNKLTNSYPAMIYAASCGTMNPRESYNCGKRTLFTNAISYVGATETVGPHNGSVGDNGDALVSMTEYYENLAELNLCAAEALNAMHLRQNNINTQWTMLYGCPEAALNLSPVCELPVPQHFTATALSKSQIQLSWDACPGAVEYHIQRSTDPSAKRAGFTDVHTVSAGTTVWEDENLPAGAKFKYRVAFQGYGFPSGFSMIDSACTFDESGNPRAPSQAPAFITGVGGSNCATITWSAVTGDVVSYNVKRSVSADGPFVTVINKDPASRSFLDSNLMNNITYHFVVSAVNQYGQSVNSAPVSLTPASDLSAPTLTSLIGYGNYRVNSNFTTSVHNETGFIVQAALRFPDGTYNNLKNISYPRRRATYGEADLATNSIYVFRVSAANEVASAPSNMLAISVPSSATNPITIQPTELTASTSGPSDISLHWKFTGSGTCDSTQIFYKLDDGTWQQTDVAYPSASAIVPRFTQVFIRAIKKNISGEPEAAISCSDFTAGSSQYEAENATLTGGAKKNTNHTGYSGTGFVDGFYNSATAQTSFTVNVPVAGSYYVKLRYSAGNGTSDNTGLYVNSSQKQKNITCATTSNWNTWADEVEMVWLNAGNNTISYKAESSSNRSINLDFLTLSLKTALATYTITASAGANGSISPGGAITVNNGANQNYAITPNSGYLVSDVKVDGASQGQITLYTFYGVIKDHTISATFVPDPCSGIQGGGNGLRGATFGMTPAYEVGAEFCRATDGEINTFYSYLQPDGAYTGLDLGTAKVIAKIRYYPRSTLASRMNGGKFQGSNTSSTSGFADLYTISGTPSEQWTTVTITNSTAYRWVRYLAPNGSYGNIAEMEFYAPMAPSAPSGLTATAVAANQINLAWVDNSTDETGFTIERSLSSGGPWNQVTTVGSNVKTYYDAQLTGGTTYWYRVKATNGIGSSDWSNTASATTPAGGYSNLAVGKTATASSEIAGGTYSAAKANDDNTTTRWAASSVTFPQWVKIDLGSQRTISEVEMMFAFAGASGDCYDFSVETSSDNTNWTTRVNQNPNSNTAQTQRYGFSTVAARYVRVTIKGAPGTNRASLYEFRVFGM